MLFLTIIVVFSTLYYFRNMAAQQEPLSAQQGCLHNDHNPPPLQMFTSKDCPSRQWTFAKQTSIVWEFLSICCRSEKVFVGCYCWIRSVILGQNVHFAGSPGKPGFSKFPIFLIKPPLRAQKKSISPIFHQKTNFGPKQ